MNPVSNASALSKNALPEKLLPVARLRRYWRGSLRFRLLALGLMPLLIAFPVIVGVVVVVGGERADNMLVANLRSNLVGANSYLNHLKSEAGLRVGQLVKSDRMVQLVVHHPGSRELHELLVTTAKGGGLDFLVVATQDGRVLSSSNGIAVGSRLPRTYVIRQAEIGAANAAIERVSIDSLSAFATELPKMAGEGQSALLINAAAHFPLTVDKADAILVGGILLNNNTALIEHMREIIFPVGVLPGDAEGLTAIYAGDTDVAVSRQQQQGLRSLGLRAQPGIVEQVIGRDEQWVGSMELAGQSMRVGFEAIADGEGRRIGMVSVGIPDAYYRKQFLMVVAVIASVMALAMLVLSVLFVRAGRELTSRLDAICRTMGEAQAGQRGVRVKDVLPGDEVSRLGQHFNDLLESISNQAEMRRVALQTVADEASRRRALFEHERDGVVILNPDGSVFEANPKAAGMLGYTPAELATMRVTDWDATLDEQAMAEIVLGVGHEGRMHESLHRRKDGTTYVAEVSISRADWSDRTFVLLLQRDISDRKAVESELLQYRSSLEQLVEQRTKELNDQSEQLNAIFTLSPDGFVSFDRNYRVSFASRAFLKMSGMREEELIGLDERAFSQRLASRSVPQAQFPGVAALRSALQAETEGHASGNRRRKLFELQGPGNRVLEVGIRLSESPSVAQILYFRDVSYETEVDRMKSEFLSTAAHELRTPMSSIYGFAQLLMLKQFEKERSQEMLRTIVRQSELMISIINELLDLARIEARRGKDFEIARLTLQDLVNEVVAGYNLPSDREPPEIVDPGTPLAIDADRRKMLQALLNILSNAYKYSPQGGAVVIRMLAETRGETARVGVQFEDRGIGMTPEQVARIFERFYRADASGSIPGTGLGMSVVKEIVELHGGEVEVSSALGEGTRVTAWLPVADSGQPALPALVADDEAEPGLDSW